MGTKSILIAIILFIAPIFLVYSQDGHYWSENYGNRSMLLSGTVNASVEDLGAVFYNPGRLGLIDNPAFAISAKVYEFKKVKVKDGVDEGVDLNKSNFGGAPSLAAGTFEVPFLKGHKFAYAFLTRQRSNADFFVRVEKEGDVVDVLPGQEVFNGKLNYSSKYNEEWIGMTWAPPLRKGIGLGVSGFLSNLDKSTSISVDMNALNEEGKAAYSSANRGYNYMAYSLLWKLGLALDFSAVRVGLTVTTPGIKLYSDGSAIFEDYLVGVDTTGDGILDDAYIFNNQDNLKIKKKSPWAIGLGLGIPFSKGTIHLSAEWYSKIGEYTILNIDPFVGQSTQDTIRFALKDKLNGVINYGAGIEWDFSEKVTAFASFATNYSAVPSEVDRFFEFKETTNNSAFQADFYQFGGGISINTKAVEITAGATYNSGQQTINRAIDFPGEEESTNTGGADTSTISYSQWRFILGFSFPFAEKFTLGKKKEGESDPK